MSKKPDTLDSLILVDLLKTLKTMVDYKTLSEHTGIPVSTLTRYVTDKTLPRRRNAIAIVEKLLRMVDLESLVRQRILSDGDEYDVSSVVSESQLIKLIVPYMAKEFTGQKLDCLLAVDKAGLALATAFAIQNNKKTYYCLTNETSFVNKWKEIKYRIKEARMWAKIYIPKDVLKCNVLLTAGVLDNIVPLKEIRSRIVESRGDVVGVFSIAATEQFLKTVKPFQLGKIVNLISL
ncbi:MAG: hypothetical protein QXR26_00150 [Candidatus Caldarchaeum sp.]